MGFIPDQPKEAAHVPYFEDVSSDTGWQGQTTGKSIETLKSEITSAISRLGGMVVGFRKGTFQTGTLKRDGFQVHYTMELPGGKLLQGRIDVAALPVKPIHHYRYGVNQEDKHREQSLKMSLFMLRDAINGLWFLQQLSPGYAPLMPFLLADKEQTISQKWADSPVMSHILPEKTSRDFIEGEVKEIK